MPEKGPARRDTGGRNQDQAPHSFRPSRREPETDVAAHRVTDQVCLIQACGLHPRRKPGRGLGEHEAAAAQRPEARKVNQVNPVILCKGRDVFDHQRLDPENPCTRTTGSPSPATR